MLALQVLQAHLLQLCPLKYSLIPKAPEIYKSRRSKDKLANQSFSYVQRYVSKDKKTIN